MTRPMGALSAARTQELMHRYNSTEFSKGERNDRTYYAVSSDGKLKIGDTFCFVWRPPAYYFDNFWYAWAYHLQLTEDIKNGK
jgi:hypothetical protein